MDIEKRLRGKNPSRVLPQLKRQAKIQLGRAQCAGFFAVLGAATLIINLFAGFLLGSLLAIVIVFTAINLISAVFDFLLYHNRLRELKAIQELVDGDAQSLPEEPE